MKPFDLEKALAGAKLVTRDGKEVTGFKKRDGSERGSLAPEIESFPYCAYAGGSFLSFNSSGNYTARKTEADLFMAEEQPMTVQTKFSFEDFTTGDVEKLITAGLLRTRDGRIVSGAKVKEGTGGDRFVVNLAKGGEWNYPKRGYFGDGTFDRHDDLVYMTDGATVEPTPVAKLEAGMWVKCVQTCVMETSSDYGKTAAEEGKFYEIATYNSPSDFRIKTNVLLNHPFDNTTEDGEYFDLENPMPCDPNDMAAYQKEKHELQQDFENSQTSILLEANGLIYGERAKAYGPVTENFGRTAERWSQIFGIKVTPEQVGLAMIDLKLSRHLNSPKRDNLVDIAGYIGCLDKLSKGE